MRPRLRALGPAYWLASHPHHFLKNEACRLPSIFPFSKRDNSPDSTTRLLNLFPMRRPSVFLLLSLEGLK